MLLRLCELGRLPQADDLSINAGASKALRVQRTQKVDKLTFATSHYGSKNLKTPPSFALKNAVRDVLDALPSNRLSTLDTVRDACSRPEQTKVVINLGNGSHSGPGVSVGGFLIDRDRRAESLNDVNVWSVNLTEELPGVGRE